MQRLHSNISSLFIPRMKLSPADYRQKLIKPKHAQVIIAGENCSDLYAAIINDPTDKTSSTYKNATFTHNDYNVQLWDLGKLSTSTIDLIHFNECQIALLAANTVDDLKKLHEACLKAIKPNLKIVVVAAENNKEIINYVKEQNLPLMQFSKNTFILRSDIVKIYNDLPLQHLNLISNFKKRMLDQSSNGDCTVVSFKK